MRPIAVVQWKRRPAAPIQTIVISTIIIVVVAVVIVIIVVVITTVVAANALMIAVREAATIWVDIRRHRRCQTVPVATTKCTASVIIIRRIADTAAA